MPDQPDDPTERPEFERLVRRFVETPPKPHDEMKLGRPRGRPARPAKPDVVPGSRSAKR